MRHRLFAIVSGLLLFTAFPPLEWNATAWVALVPLLIAVAQMTPARAFRVGLVAGLMFWWPSLVWLSRVSWAGWLILGVFCALFIALFSMWASAVLCSGWLRGRMGTLGALLVIPVGWAGLEFVRSTLFTGFSWNPLGVTQTGVLPLIQCAEWGGVYVVSFMVVMVNVALALGLLALIHVDFNRRGRTGSPAGRMPEARRDHASGVGGRLFIPLRAGSLPAEEDQGSTAEPAVGQRTAGVRRLGSVLPLVVALAVVLLAWAGGSAAIRREDGRPGAPLRVALIQLNIPQFEKMVEECWGEIELRLRRSTAAAINTHHPELVIWPETAVPTFVRGVPSTEQVIADLLTQGVPLLVGAMDFAKQGDNIIYFNSSFLFDPERGLVQTYAKQHLVCFGEYVPLGDAIPFLRRLTPIEESFTAGTVQTVFRLDSSSRAFAVLICFEDTVAALGRAAVRAGARLLVNQTNDAWFDPSWAPRQHMLQCVFRCVENRVPAVRSSNTGITCVIDATGRVTASLPPTCDSDQQPECLARTVQLPDPDMPLTFYTRHGDLFAGACVGLTLLLAGAMTLQRKRAGTKTIEYL